MLFVRIIWFKKSPVSFEIFQKRWRVFSREERRDFVDLFMKKLYLV